MTKKGKGFTAGFLGVTVLAIITELIFAFDGNTDTHPWTDLIVEYVPWELGLAAFGALLLWVPIHFYVRYRRKQKKKYVITALKERIEKGQTGTPPELLMDAVRVMSPEEFNNFKRDYLDALVKGQITVVEECPHGYTDGKGCSICNA